MRPIRLARYPLLALFLGCLALPAWAINISFLNPGRSDELFWVSVSRFMQLAADDLKIELDILYAERDPARMIENARAVLARPKKPDYLIVVNEKQVGLEITKLTEKSGIKVFMLLSTLTEEQKQALEQGGGKSTHLIGSLVANHQDAGYLTAKALIAASRQLPPRQQTEQMIVLAGDAITPASIERNAGLQRALREHPEIRLAQLVYSEWNKARASQQMGILMKRYPEARLVWAASDQISFGAMQAATARGETPGQSMLFSAINNSTEAMASRVSGRLSALAAGHFTAGGWALVMLHDHHAGKTLMQTGGSDRIAPLFALIDDKQARRFLERFGEEAYRPVNFRQYSLVYQPKLQRHAFSLLPLLQ